MAMIGCAAEALKTGAKVGQHVSEWLFDGPKNVFGNIDPLSDLLKLIQRINEIAKPYIELLPLQHIANAVSKITDFVNARNWIGRISDIASGRAAWDHPFGVNFPDILKVASKCAYLIGDFAATAKWLSSIEILGAWVKDSTAQLVTWGKEFNILKGIGDVSCVTGALLNIADTVRLIVKETLDGGYLRNGRLQFGLLLDHVLDVAYDDTKVAASVLSNIPGVPIVFTLVSLAVGSTLSLGKFFKKTYWNDRDPFLRLSANGETQEGERFHSSFSTPDGESNSVETNIERIDAEGSDADEIEEEDAELPVDFDSVVSGACTDESVVGKVLSREMGVEQGQPVKR
jgi:hypothetical protein